MVPFLHLRARLQYRAGMRKGPTSNAAKNYSKLSALIGNSRTLWRIWGIFTHYCRIYNHKNNHSYPGILPIFQWLKTIENTPPATRKLLTIERLQGWSMLFYYPLEQLSYLSCHGIVPTSFTIPSSIFSTKKRKITVNPDILSLWSCRFWAVYVILHIFHLIEDRKLLRQRHASIRKARGTGLSKEEREEMTQRWDAFWSEVVINLGYLPMTIHWYDCSFVQMQGPYLVDALGRFKMGSSRMRYAALDQNGGHVFNTQTDVD